MIVRFLGAQWLAIGFVGLVSFGISILVARTLGPDQFGVYAIALSVGAMLAILIDGGFGKLLQRERARVTESLTNELTILPGLAYGHAFLVILVMSVLSMLLFPKQSLTVLVALLYFGAAGLNQFGLAILRGDGRLVRDASWQMGNRTFTAVCILIALFMGANQPWQVFMAQFIGASAFGFSVTRYLHIRPLFRLSPKVYRAVLPFVWLDFASVLYFRADMVIFQYLGLVKLDVGKYGVAYRLIEAVVLFASPVGLILFRRFRQDSVAPVRMVREMLPALLGAALIGVGLVLILWLFSNDIIALAYGTAYQGAGGLLMILGCSLIFILPNGVLNQAALALGLERWFAVSATVAAVTNIAGNLLLIPIYGAVAAAWMTVLTEAVLGACVAGGVIVRCRQFNGVEGLS